MFAVDSTNIYKAGQLWGYAEHEFYVVAVSGHEIVVNHNLSGEFQVYSLLRWHVLVSDKLMDCSPSVDPVPVAGVHATIADRQRIYGDFGEVAALAQKLKNAIHASDYYLMGESHREALDMICSKIARIVCGDHNHADSWHDISGYATLVESGIKAAMKPAPDGDLT